MLSIHFGDDAGSNMTAVLALRKSATAALPRGRVYSYLD
jgi:hypothetical protein